MIIMLAESCAEEVQKCTAAASNPAKEGKMTTTIAKTKKRNKTVQKTRSHPSGATAIHGAHGTDHIVGIGNLRVIMCEDNGIWFAQGLEIDYAANGKSLAQVKRNFEHGLAATIKLHLQAFDSIDKLLVPAPADTWKELTEIKKSFRFSQVSVHEFEGDAKELLRLPYTGISYLERETEVAA
jgi:hypothetical protein